MLTSKGQHEVLKATMHGMMMTLAALFTAYNIVAYHRRGEYHLARNVIIYGALTALETLQVSSHTTTSNRLKG